MRSPFRARQVAVAGRQDCRSPTKTSCVVIHTPPDCSEDQLVGPPDAHVVHQPGDVERTVAPAVSVVVVGFSVAEPDPCSNVSSSAYRRIGVVDRRGPAPIRAGQQHARRATGIGRTRPSSSTSLPARARTASRTRRMSSSSTGTRITPPMPSGFRQRIELGDHERRCQGQVALEPERPGIDRPRSGSGRRAAAAPSPRAGLAEHDDLVRSCEPDPASGHRPGRAPGRTACFQNRGDSRASNWSSRTTPDAASSQLIDSSRRSAETADPVRSPERRGHVGLEVDERSGMVERQADPRPRDAPGCRSADVGSGSALTNTPWKPNNLATSAPTGDIATPVNASARIIATTQRTLARSQSLTRPRAIADPQARSRHACRPRPGSGRRLPAAATALRSGVACASSRSARFDAAPVVVSHRFARLLAGRSTRSRRSADRSRPSPRLSRDFTVPLGRPRTVAVSASPRSRK